MQEGKRACRISDRRLRIRRRPRQSTFRTPRFGIKFLSLCLILTATAATCAQPSEHRLLDRKPFDVVILDEANNNALLEVFPLDLPGREVPTPHPTGKLELRLLDEPLYVEAHEVSWEHVQEIHLFEEMLRDEARRLTSQGEFDEAFDYYERLLSEYKTLPGLDEDVNDYLRRNALALYQAGEYERALAVLGSLYERDPESPGLVDAVDAVAGKMIERHVRQQDYAVARAELDLRRKRFPTLASSGVEEWERRFTTAATRKLEESRGFLAEQKYVAAYQAIDDAVAIWPELSAAHDLLVEIQRQHGFVAVGVTETSPRHPVWRIDCWPALRTSPLVAPTLAELVGFGSEGGVYRCPFGEMELDVSGQRLNLKLDLPSGANGAGARLPTDTLVRYFLATADPASPRFRSTWGGLLAGVSVAGDGSVNLEWARPHVRPEALLQIPPPPISDDGSSGDSSSFARWVMLPDSEAGTVVFSATGTSGRRRGAPRSIIERTMPNEESAIKALLVGDVDMLDRVPPWQVARLRSAQDIHVRPYRLPTVHVLILNSSNPLLRSREFRRALCYGINRQQIVGQVLLGGGELPGFEVVSGPFPTGMSLSDPLRYAYNNRIAPRTYEPRLAAVLSTVAWYNVLDPQGKGGVEFTDMPELVLAHPADPMIRVLCQTIQLQLDVVGISVKLQEYGADELLNGEVECDLRYAELAMWEPVVDAARLLGPGGLAGGDDSDYLVAALRKLDTAGSWQEVRACLAEIHEIAHYDLPVIPLWQTANYFAYRSSLQDVEEQPVTLYQDVDQWDVTYSGGSRSVATGR